MTSTTHKVNRSQRGGLTLFELLLALAIFLASLAALAQLLASGSRAAAQAKLQTEAILRCESKLAEVVSGIEPIQAASSGNFDDDPNWTWRLTAADGPWQSLLLIELRVSHRGQSSLSSSSYILRRYVRDPRQFVKQVGRRASTFATPSNNASPTARESEDAGG